MSLLSDWSSPHPSDLSLAVARRRAAGLPLVDLITANPHEHGFVCDPSLVERALLHGLRSRAIYRPDARGAHEAREAIAEWHGGGAAAEQVVLTPGTSLAYFYAFRLLAERGEVLCPTPTYPLFDDLARMAGVGVRRYHLGCREGRWFIDPEEVAFQVTSSTRVLVLVSPHNPTGHVVSAEEVEALCAIARRHDLAIVFDEVFRDVLHRVDGVPRPSEHGAPLCVTLNGLSKRLALPGLKAGWMVVEGDAAKRDALLQALEYLSDTLLPVNEAVQGAMPMLMREGESEVQRLAALSRVRVRTMLTAARDGGFAMAEPDGGIYGLLPLDEEWRGRDEEMAVQGVKQHGVLLHPGTLYGIQEPHLVMTATSGAEKLGFEISPRSR
jgi:aspartate/methionine/tyrosine aminotransferase